MTKTYSCGYGHSYTAKDAHEDIDPAEILKAIVDFKATIDESIAEIGKDLRTIRPDACNAIRNYNRDMGYKFDELEVSLVGMKEAIVSITDTLYSDAVKKYRELQNKYDDEAKKQASDCAARDKAAAEAAAAAAAATAGEAPATTN